MLMRLTYLCKAHCLASVATGSSPTPDCSALQILAENSPQPSKHLLIQSPLLLCRSMGAGDFGAGSSPPNGGPKESIFGGARDALMDAADAAKQTFTGHAMATVASDSNLDMYQSLPDRQAAVRLLSKTSSCWASCGQEAAGKQPLHVSCWVNIDMHREVQAGCFRAADHKRPLPSFCLATKHVHGEGQGFSGNMHEGFAEQAWRQLALFIKHTLRSCNQPLLQCSRWCRSHSHNLLLQAVQGSG